MSIRWRTSPTFSPGSSTVIQTVTSICYCHGPTESQTSGPWPENDAYGSPAPRDRSAAPIGSQKHIPRPASGSSVPDRSTADPWTNSEVQVRCEARIDQEQRRSSAPGDLQVQHRKTKLVEQLTLVTLQTARSWIDLAENRHDRILEL
jgi:hypothetical protein